MRVFVLDKKLKPLDPYHQARARELLDKGRAKVFRRYPFTIVLQDRVFEASVTNSHQSRSILAARLRVLLWFKKRRGELLTH